jgi:CheY-like chemotaxis protein
VQSRPITVLCVDDEAGALTLRELLLEKSGYTVLPARKAATALQIFKSHNVDLVISDHLLPDLTGADLTREMKLAKPFVPMMLLSGVTEPPAGAEHADLFINKARRTGCVSRKSGRPAQKQPNYRGKLLCRGSLRQAFSAKHLALHHPETAVTRHFVVEPGSQRESGHEGCSKADALPFSAD